MIYQLSSDTLLNRTVYVENPPKTNGFSKFRSTLWECREYWRSTEHLCCIALLERLCSVYRAW